jgi:DNA recombination protein RmuC
MEILLLFLGSLVGAATAYAWAVRRSGRTAPGAGDVAALRADVERLGERVSSESLVLSQRLEGIDTRMSRSQASNADLARGIFETLGDVRSATSSVAEQARQFSSLQDLLKPPKARGGVGEAMLEELLRQILPPSGYGLQHRFSSGLIVDAVVKAGGRLVCIDAKFPMSNYAAMCDAVTDAERQVAERAFAADVDKHLRDIQQRYIVPDESTFDFAVMYVPAEGVYGQILRLKHRGAPLYERAMELRVIPMSPLTMYGYLQTILFGLKCLQIEESAEAILGYCGRLQSDMARFATDYDTLGRHLTNAHAKYSEGARRLEHFRGKLDRVIELGAEDDAGGSPPLEVVAD